MMKNVQCHYHPLVLWLRIKRATTYDTIIICNECAREFIPTAKSAAPILSSAINVTRRFFLLHFCQSNFDAKTKTAAAAAKK